jgi:capsular polysaccharide biosynthesis protein
MLTGAAAGFTLAQTPTYEASIKMLVGQERATPETPLLDVGSLGKVTRTISETVKSRPVAEAVARQLGPPTAPDDVLGERLKVSQIGDTQLIQVSYEDPSPQRAQEVANAVGDVFSEQVPQLSASGSAITTTVLEQAEVPNAPKSPNLKYNIGAALVIGLILGIGLAFLLEYLDDSWRSPEEAEQVSGVPAFGVIPQFRALMGTDKEKR